MGVGGLAASRVPPGHEFVAVGEGECKNVEYKDSLHTNDTTWGSGTTTVTSNAYQVAKGNTGSGHLWRASMEKI